MKIKKFFSRSVLVIGGLIGAVLPIYFSVAQNYDTIDLYSWTLHFLMPKHPVYLYAVTAPNTYTVNFDGNWSTAWSMGSMDMTYDQEVNLLANNFTRDWYTFEWWSRSAMWSVEYVDQEGVKNLTSTDLWTVTLYAKRALEASYTAIYYQENVDWTWYDFVETWTEYTTSDTMVILTWRTYTWFTLQTWAEVTINPDWSTEVPFYYKRNTYNLIVHDRGKIPIDTWVKYWVEIMSIVPETLTWWTWNTFSWWQWIPEWGLMPANDLEITSEWTYGEHSVTFDTDWWSGIATITGNYGDSITPPPNPTKEGYEFVWWKPEIPATIWYDDVTVVAQWRAVQEESRRWWSGWWWRRSGGWSDSWEWWDEHGSAVDQIVDITESYNQNRANMEVLIAYMWAHSRWIIDTEWKDSDPDGYVLRWEMAKMVVRFTENVLWRKVPGIPIQCHWIDVESEWQTKERKEYAEKACALWVMWLYMDNFLPNKVLDRAEFGTILSRLLWWDKYDVVDATETKLYYTRHLWALNREWIMKQIDNPVERKELRKWAWLMLMRVKT